MHEWRDSLTGNAETIRSAMQTRLNNFKQSSQDVVFLCRDHVQKDSHDIAMSDDITKSGNMKFGTQDYSAGTRFFLVDNGYVPGEHIERVEPEVRGNQVVAGELFRTDDPRVGIFVKYYFANDKMESREWYAVKRYSEVLETIKAAS